MKNGPCAAARRSPRTSPAGSLELAVRWRHDAATCLGSQTLVAGVSEDLNGGAVDELLDQAQLAGVSDVGAACAFGGAAEQHPPFRVGEDHGLDGVLLVLSGDELVPVLTADGRPADWDLCTVNDSGLPAGAEVVDDLGERAQATPWEMVQPRSASRGRTSPMARGTVDRSKPNQQASTSWVAPWRRCTSVARSQSMKTSRCFAPAPTACFRGLATKLSWWRSRHNGPNSATSSAITSADKPVVAARAPVPTTKP